MLKLQARATKRVLLYSTKHHRSKFVGQTPEIIHEYNHTKFGVDIFDEMTRRYSYAPRTNRWPFRLFFFMIEAAALNAQTLTGSQTSRRSFLYELSSQLMDEKLQARAESDHWTVRFYRDISASLDELADKLVGNEKSATMEHCIVCSKTLRNPHVCEKCNKPGCSDHLQQRFYCDNCCQEIAEVEIPPRKVPTSVSFAQPTIGQCYECGTKVHVFCMICGNPMCRNHRNPIDRTLCKNCPQD